MENVEVDEVDLSALVAGLRRDFGNDPPVGYLRGRTAIRDAVVRRLGCSALEAEELVDTMESRGFLHYPADPSRRSRTDEPWTLG
jgi:hypothetical protein